MARIQSTLGLITGVPIVETVDKLMAVSARARNLLSDRTEALRQQQLALSQLMAQVLGVQLAARALDSEAIFAERRVSTSAEQQLSARVTGQPVQGTYQFTPVRVAQSHQLVSAGLAATDQPLGGGVLRLRTGAQVDRSVELSELNGGTGVQRGKIRITDRSGASEVIDLRFAHTVDDVLRAINEAQGVNVSADVYGDALRLSDHTGQTVSNLKVQEIGLGETAADLGWAGIDTAADTATGADLIQLHEAVRLHRLNDGNGVWLRPGLPDLEITFRDGSEPLQVDFGDLQATEATLGQLLETLNAADPVRLQARIAADGERLELVDLTSDTGGAFSVSSPLAGGLAESLGLAVAASGDTISGRRLLAGPQSVLLASLNGGRGLGELGQLDLTDRTGAAASADLSGAETLNEVIHLINAAGLAIRAEVNEQGNGLRLRDTSGASASNLIVASGDGTGTAEKLGLTADVAASEVNSGDLLLQVVSRQTSLDSYRGGGGVRSGSFLITDSAGNSEAVNLTLLDAQTVGDVIEAVNGLGIGVEASINASGDGILLVNTAGGAGAMTVVDSGNGTAAADLGLAGTAATLEVDGVEVEGIDGATTHQLTFDAEATLEDVVQAINDLDAGLQASVFYDGSSTTPYRLLLASEVSGRAGEWMVDASELGLAFQELTPAQDALLVRGSLDSLGAGLLAASSTNTFSSVLDGVELSVLGAAQEPVTVSVHDSDATLISKVKLFVDQYNKLQDTLDQFTFFNEEENTTGILFGSGETLRIETSLSTLLTGRFLGAGSVRSLAELGLDFQEDGRLELDSDKLAERFAQDPDATREFFVTDSFGFADKVKAVVDSLAGEGDSLLLTRNQSLQSRIETNEERLAFMDERLDWERERLLQQFYAMELAVSRLQSNLSALSAIQALPSLVSSRQ